jgi:aminoglycoside phosphotransferase (APT) family kinase protein
MERETARAILATLLGNEEIASCEPLRGGFSTEMTKVVSSDGTAFVIRSCSDVDACAREVAFQGTLASMGFPTVAVLAHGVHRDRPFIVMPFVRGRPFVDLDSPRDMLGAFKRVPTVLADVMIELHRVDPAGVADALGSDNRPDDVDWTLQAIGGRRSLLDPDLARAFDRLRASRPSGEIVVCHGDLHPANLIVDEAGSVVLLDWEVAVLAPREYDVARSQLMLELIPGIRVPAILPLLQVFGRRSAKAFVARYAQSETLDRARLRWYRQLAALRLLVLVIGAEPESAIAANWNPTRRGLRRIALSALEAAM